MKPSGIYTHTELTPIHVYNTFGNKKMFNQFVVQIMQPSIGIIQVNSFVCWNKQINKWPNIPNIFGPNE